MAKAPKESAKEFMTLGTIAKQTGESLKSSFLGAVASTVSLQTGIKLVTAELEKQRRIAEEARRTNLSVADSQAAVIKNIGDVNREQLGQFLGNVQRVGRESGFADVAQLNLAAADVLSAAGGDQAKTIEILKTAAAFFKDAPGDLAKFSGSMADVMKATGDPDAKRAMALMLSIQGQARFTSLDAFKNVTPALASSVVTQRGVDPVRATREAAALFAGIGQRAGDPEGSVTKTAVANLSANLETMFPTAGLSVLERLRMAQQANQATKDKLAESGFEGAMRPIIKDLLSSPESQTSAMIAEAFRNINASEAFANQKRDLLTGGTAQLELSGSARRTSGRIQAFELGGNVALSAEIRNKVSQVLDKTAGSTDAFLMQARLEAMLARGVDPRAAGASILQEAEESVRMGQRGFLRSILSDDLAPDSELSQSRREMINLLRDTKEEIKRLRATSEGTENNTRRAAQVPAGAQRNVHQEAD